ncbi:MAG TPA: hypothetical protein VEC13_03390 [Candidatus Paceibacterota bacterium]|nr:hypothetical protein [Candidatus Paceibacterota bacterium]
MSLEHPSEEFNLSPEPGKDFDPRESSIIGVRGLEKVGQSEDGKADRFVDKDGRVFYGEIKPDKHPADQMLTARILKGIIPVSDVVAVQTDEGVKFYSHELPLDKIKPKEVSSTDSMESYADTLFLKFIFSDDDHYPESLNMYSENTHHALYDFDEASDFWKKNFGRDEKNYVRFLSPQEKSLLIERARALEDRLKGKDGLAFLESVVESVRKEGNLESGMLKTKEGQKKLPFRQVKKLRDEIIRRAERLEEMTGE